MNRLAPFETPCLGKLFFAWALYGWAMLVLWHFTHRDPLAGAVTWVVGLLAAGGLMIVMREL